MYAQTPYMAGYHTPAPMPEPTSFGGGGYTAGGLMLAVGGALALGVAAIGLGAWAGWAIAGHFAAPAVIQWSAAIVGAPIGYAVTALLMRLFRGSNSLPSRPSGSSGPRVKTEHGSYTINY